jgi:uncharacterized membrane protein
LIDRPLRDLSGDGENRIEGPETEAPRATVAYPFPAAEERALKVQRAELGSLLLFAGMLIIWAPFASVLGIALVFVGAFLVIMGDEVFGPAHARNSLVAGVILFIGLMGTMAAVRNLREVLLDEEPSQQEAIFTNYLILIVFLLIAVGVAEVLITYELQRPAGRRLLWAGLLSWAAFVMFAAFQLRASVPAALVATGVTPLGLVAEALPYVALRAVPAMLYAAAYYMVWTSIKRGELPTGGQEESDSR